MKLRYKILNSFLALFIVAVLSLMFVLSRTTPCEGVELTNTVADPMQAIIYECYGGPDVLAERKTEKPKITKDEILVKVKAASVNPLDWHFMRGSPYLMRLQSGLGKPDDPRTGVDFAGTVEAVGGAVKDFKVGDDVFGGGDGAFAEYLSAKGKNITIKPPTISFEHAAASPIAALTALQGLRDFGNLKAGQRVLINGSSGGVGTFAVQIAKSMGAEVTAVCSTQKAAMVKSLGADHIFDYKKEDFVASGQLYDLVMDNVGNRSISDLRKVLKPNGVLVMIGGSKGDWVGPFKNILVATIMAPFVSQELKFMIAEFNRTDLDKLGELIQSGQVKPVIDRRYSLSEVPDAMRYSEAGRARGKIIITM
jgi:NADPH:quinone reductase-like Zn-dependent oxidoreductase